MIAQFAVSPVVLGLGTPVFAFLVGGTALLIGIRFRIPWVTDRVRRVNRSLINPRWMRSAGKAGSGVAVLRHNGRRSGTPYETPISAKPCDDGFVVPLTYGPQTDWFQNLAAAGSANLIVDGEEVIVDRPELVPTESVLSAFALYERIGLRLFGIEECLVLHRTSPTAQ